MGDEVIVVAGANGNVGREVVAALRERDVAVRALVRDPGRATASDGVEPVAGDLTDPASLGPALTGAQAVFLMPGFPGAAAAVRDAGVPRIVLLSGGSAGLGDQANAVTRYMSAAEAEVRDTGLEWTVLRPAAFMANALRWKPQLDAGDTVRVPFADVALACVDPADIGAVAAAALVEDGHRFMIYKPTGPQAMVPAQQVEILGDVLGRPLRCVAQSNAEARRTMLETTPPEYVAAFFDFYVNGALDESPVLPTVEDVTGRPPRTFRDWAQAHVAEF